jgi:hypothetical protein
MNFTRQLREGTKRKFLFGRGVNCLWHCYEINNLIILLQFILFKTPGKVELTLSIIRQL